jgi:hypothetical protein
MRWIRQRRGGTDGQDEQRLTSSHRRRRAERTPRLIEVAGMETTDWRGAALHLPSPPASDGATGFCRRFRAGARGQGISYLAIGRRWLDQSIMASNRINEEAEQSTKEAQSMRPAVP